MKKPLMALLGLATVAAVLPVGSQAEAQTRIGTLNCNVAPGVGLILGSRKSVDCVYRAAGGRYYEHYVGSIGRLGIDIGFTKNAHLPPPRPEELIAAYRQIVARAHDHGIKVFGATILPYKGAGYRSEEGDRVRQAVNVWIRTPGNFDGVIDFDRATADPADPLKMRAEYDSGDHLHPNDAGYAAMGRAIKLDMFR